MIRAGAPEVREFIRRCLSDTGYICRNLLGWNYDEDEAGTKHNVGNGGVLSHGAHQEMVTLLDNPHTKFKLLEAPRGSYKSTILQGFCVRQLLLNPDVRIMYVCRSDDQAEKKSISIRNAMLLPRVQEIFGPQQGAPWDVRGWTVAGRRQTNLATESFSVFSMESMPTGARANFVILDDFIDDKNCTNAEMLEKSKQAYERIQPFIAKGGTLIVVGTRWEDDDLYSELEGSRLFKPPYGEQLILGAGVVVVRDEEGHVDLEESEDGVTFPHLTLDFLRQKLYGMSRKGEAKQFYAQYLNQIVSGRGSVFRRHFFRQLNWGPDMEALSGYLLTDTATSQEKEGCHSVIAYVGLDKVDNLYLLDLRVSHWQPGEFVNVFFDVLETWKDKVNHCGEVWEEISLTTVFNYALESDSRARKTRLNRILVPRTNVKRKDERILRLHAPMYHSHFWVVNTVPRTYDDVDGVHELWNPDGHYDGWTKTNQPSGELVDQFIRLGTHPRKDIADTLAMVLENRKGRRGMVRRVCSYRPWNPKPAKSLTQTRTDVYRAAHSGPDPTDWWDTVTRNLHGHDDHSW